MKNLLFALLLFPIFSFAQVIPEKANLITVMNTETAYANFTDVRLLLTKKGIEIANLDKDAFDIKTGLIEVKGSGSGYYEFFCRDNQIIISGKSKKSFENTQGENKTATDLEAIVNTGAKDSPTRLSFEAMKEMAKLFGTKIKYEVSKYYQ
ncbi:hypothetical protein EZ428_16395 [Pedobacter frigiditerrae]|uniref:DUF4468 domain-containing protein n=1 Tax=Pedobacter frigiditerrae TaxID=2530452 RepID=A0A4R0MQX3_9SPHI|nr:hypothetical protein [Pedobacter frigiditerrae]TCC89275.1 hypothetical protein EZ428_16395 [Pedobacter frigiditerrae]